MLDRVTSKPFIDRGAETSLGSPGLWIQISHRFGPRMTEWMIATITAMLGVVFLLPSQSFSGSSWILFSLLLSENGWGVVYLLLGLLRIGGLIVNGARKNVTPWIRVISAAIGFLIWVGMCLAFAFSGVVGPWLAIYPVIAVTELVNIYRAATDAGEYHVTRRSS